MWVLIAHESSRDVDTYGLHAPPDMCKTVGVTERSIGPDTD